jgi:hypothetical protein
MADDRLREDEVARVLRRAAELEAASGPAAGDEGLPVAAVEAAAAEVGLSPAAVRQAVAELRTGALDGPVEDPGPALVVCARVVPGSCEACLDAVDTYLSRQALVRARDRGLEQVWRPREDIVARMQRRLDFAAAIRLRAVDEVVVRAMAVEGGTLVRVVARLDPQVARAPGIAGGAGAAVGAVGGGVLGAALGEPALVLAGIPVVGAGAGALGWGVGRRVRAGQREKVAESIEGLLDELELGRPLASGRGSLDRLAARARRLRGGYRA